jgi:hypothetical protein
MSRRDNGLPGADWHRLTDLEPPLADHVLEALAAADIAAYAEPPEPRGDVYFGAWPPTTRHVDGVFVPLDALDRARDVLNDLLPELGAAYATDAADAPPASGTSAAVDPARPVDAAAARPGPSDDDVWAGIVASYAAPPADRAGKEPESPLTAPAEATSAETAHDAAATDAPGVAREATGFEDIRAELDAARAAAGTPAQPDADDDDHFVPPEPEPLPRTDDITIAAWVCLITGPVFLVLATILDWNRGGLASLLAVFATIGGFVVLVARMRDERDEDDDGAVV